MGIGLRTATAEAFGTMAKMGAIDLSFLDRVTFRDRSLAREVLVLFGEQADSLLVVIAEAGDERTREYQTATSATRPAKDRTEVADDTFVSRWETEEAWVGLTGGCPRWWGGWPGARQWITTTRTGSPWRW